MTKAQRDRLFSLDVARGFAVVAMLVAHTAPFIVPAPKWVAFPEGILNDVAAPLFALIIGVTLAITVSGSKSTSTARTPFRLQFAIKAILLIAIGFALELAPSGVDIVLDYLGVSMLLCLPFVFLRTHTILCWAVGLITVAPGITTFLRAQQNVAPLLVTNNTTLNSALDWLVLGRNYQVPILLSMTLLGIVIGRNTLTNKRVLVRLFSGSAAGYFLFRICSSFAGLESISSIRGGYVEVFEEAALTLAAFTAIILVCDHSRILEAKTVRLITRFTSVQGRLALSVYVFHVVLLMGFIRIGYAAGPSITRWYSAPWGWGIQVGLILLCWIASHLWWRRFGTGPVERAIAFISRRHRLAKRPAGSTDSNSR